MDNPTANRPVPLRLVRPAHEHLASYLAALDQGWSPDSGRGAEAIRAEQEAIARDADLFLARMVDRKAAGGPVVLADGSTVKRLPGYRYWLWDGEFCGHISFRWQPGTTDLPPTCLGHIGYSVVPWKRRRGYATEALRQLLPLTRQEGLPFVELTTDVDNVASQRVIEANGGVLFEHFTKPACYGGTPGLRYRITLA